MLSRVCVEGDQSWQTTTEKEFNNVRLFWKGGQAKGWTRTGWSIQPFNYDLVCNCTFSTEHVQSKLEVNHRRASSVPTNLGSVIDYDRQCNDSRNARLLVNAQMDDAILPSVSCTGIRPGVVRQTILRGEKSGTGAVWLVCIVCTCSNHGSSRSSSHKSQSNTRKKSKLW